MERKEIISYAESIEDMAAVVTDSVFTVEFFNSAAEKLIPDIRVGAQIDNDVEIHGKGKLRRSRYSALTTAKVVGQRCFCAFIPVIVSSRRKCIFLLAELVQRENVDSLKYLSAKISVLNRLINAESGDDLSETREKLLTDYVRELENTERLLAVMEGSSGVASREVRPYLEQLFAYYYSTKFKDKNEPGFKIFTECEYEKLGKQHTVCLAFTLDNCVRLSRNGTVNLHVFERRGDLVFRALFRPKKRLKDSMKSTDVAEDVFYYASGDEMCGLYYIKILAGCFNGQVSFACSPENDEACIEIRSPVIHSDFVMSGEENEAELAFFVAADMLSVE